MQPSNRPYTVLRSKAATTASFMSRVYFWMMAGVFISGVTAFVVASKPEWVFTLVQNRGLFFGLVLAQLIAVIVLSAAAQRMSVGMASAVYALYATLTGITFSTLFLAYSMQSLASAFFTTAFAFGGLSFYGSVTKRDLGPIGSFCTMGLFGMLGLMLLSFFIPALAGNSVQLGISAIGVLVFSGLTAYDTQRIKALQYQFADDEQARKGAINGALILYLDFINLFLSILRLMGDRR